MEVPIRVLVVDESPGLAHDLSLVFRRRRGVRVLGPVADAREATDVLADGLADLVVVDLDRDDGLGAETVSAIRAASDRAPVLAATSRPSPEGPAGALAAGACGVLPDGVDADALLDAFRRAVAGELVLPAHDLSSVLDRIHDRPPGGSDAARLARLTGREREILRLLAEGRSTFEVAAELGISVGTVQSHVKNLLAKLGAHSKVEAIRLVLRAGPVTSRTA